MHTIPNKVADSGLVTISLKQLIHSNDVRIIDLSDWLYEGLILREDDFKAQIKNYPWDTLTHRATVITCTTDAIIPMWAWMQIAGKLTEHKASVFYSEPSDIDRVRLLAAIAALNPEEYRDKRVLVNGCQHPAITPATYIAITTKLLPVVKSLMYGEACSNVPVFKRR